MPELKVTFLHIVINIIIEYSTPAMFLQIGVNVGVTDHILCGKLLLALF